MQQPPHVPHLPPSLPADTACAPLWDGERCTFSGLLTTSDIVDIMRVFYTPGSGAPASQALSELTIGAWRSFAGSVDGLARGLSSPDFQRASDAVIAAKHASRSEAGGSSAASSSREGVNESKLAEGEREERQQAQADVVMGAPHGQQGGIHGGGDSSKVTSLEAAALRRAHRVHKRLISIDPEEDLLSVCSKLRKYRIHHMPVLDAEQAAIICILSHRHLLQHLVNRFADSRRLFDVPLYVLSVGSFDDVVVVPTSASVISVLNVLAERRISAVPLVNEAGQVVDVYSRDDVTFLAHDPSLMVLDAPVGEVRRAQVGMMGPSTPLVTCDKMDSLHRALELFGATAGRCERLVCVDEHRRCTGVVSLSDIFAFFASREPVRLRPGWEGSGGSPVAGGMGPGAGASGGSQEALGLPVDGIGGAHAAGSSAMEI